MHEDNLFRRVIIFDNWKKFDPNLNINMQSLFRIGCARREAEDQYPRERRNRVVLGQKVSDRFISHPARAAAMLKMWVAFSQFWLGPVSRKVCSFQSRWARYKTPDQFSAFTSLHFFTSGKIHEPSGDSGLAPDCLNLLTSQPPISTVKTTLLKRVSTLVENPSLYHESLYLP